MKLSDISVPEVYKESADFRFFLNWFTLCLSKIQYQHDNLIDLYDCLRCPDELLWLLADTMGYRYDDRLPPAFNRLVMLYFASMIRYKGSRNGMILAAQTNLAQFRILKELNDSDDPIRSSRLEDTSIPVNSVYVASFPDRGYIDVVYFADKVPTDVCIEYVRPIGMYCFQHAGIEMSARSRIHVDARLTNELDLGMSIGPTRVGIYRRDDYARMQKADGKNVIDRNHRRNYSNFRNVKAEGSAAVGINAGVRALYNLQVCNNMQTVQSLGKVFELGYDESSVSVGKPADAIKPAVQTAKEWNLFHSPGQEWENSNGAILPHDGVRVNPPMASIGDAIQMSSDATSRVYTDVDEATGTVTIPPTE